MSEIRALDKLRKCANHESTGFFVNLEQTFGLHRYKCGDSTVKPNGRMILNSIADAIESEIAERFMALPLDADGVPIRVGEEMTCHGDVFTVCAVAPAKIHRWVTVKLGETQTTYSYDPMECTHYNPRTLEDVLKELACDVRKEWIENAPLAEHVYSEYADEIRELMKEGGE